MSLYVEGDLPYSCGNNGYNNGLGDWSWIIGLALVGGLFGGWGNGGFGFGGNRGGYGYGGVGENYILATDFATIERKLDSVNNGICDSTFALNNTITNGFFGVQNSLTQGFAGLNTVINTGFSGVDKSFCDLSHQLADCCCATQRAIDSVKFENCQNTGAIINAINAGNQRLVDIYTNDKIEALRAENAALKGRISDDYQADRIINKLSPCPVPAYITCDPRVPYNYNNNCGCGCGA